MKTQKTGFLKRQNFGFDMESMAPAHWLAVALAAITGTVHIYLYLNEGFLPFLFAGVVFYGAIVAILLNVFRRVVYALGVPFTAGQIGIWVLMGMPNFTLGVFDKVLQIALIALLVYLFLNENRLVPETETEIAGEPALGN